MAPSIQVGLLQSLAQQHGHHCDTFYFNLDFARELGRDIYEQIAHLPLPLVGEWLFSVAAFNEAAPDPDNELLATIDLPQLERRLGLSAKQLKEIRYKVAPALIRDLATRVDFAAYDVVGFSSVFQQTLAAISLARLLKKIAPQVITIFGGANFQDEMGIELLRKIEWIDYVATGEADYSFPEFLAAIAEGREPQDLPNIVGRNNPAAVVTLTTELDCLPTPNYEDFFRRAEELSLLSDDLRTQIELPIEASRGCWWGAKHHCTFCGLDPATMTFRSKSAERIVDELTELAKNHGTFRFLATDAIVNLSHLKNLFPMLASRRLAMDLFFEVKSNIGREELRTLRQGGVNRIQPGVESLSSLVLSLMDKGVTGIQNINFLRWARYYDFSVDWNFIWGFPGEKESSYFEMAETIRHLHHLTPPTNIGPVQMHRFSPIFRDRTRFPVRYKRAENSYRFAFPNYINLDAIAYYFDYEFETELPEHAHEVLKAAVDEWCERWNQAPQPHLTFRFAPDIVIIEDSRVARQTTSYTLRGPIANIYELCSDRPTSVRQIQSKVGSEFTAGDIADALDDLVKRGLVVSEGDTYLSLAFPAGAQL
jgi:ribosomal peptide maturation radical SAM protein 1